MLRPDRLGLALRFLRTRRKLRQRDVAARAGITSSMLSGYENGRKLPTLSSLDKILEALGASLRELVDTLERQHDGDPVAGAPQQAPVRLLRRAERSPLPELHFDLSAIFGADAELAREEERAFGEMLRGYCRWLRFLRDAGAELGDAHADARPREETADERADEAIEGPG